MILAVYRSRETKAISRVHEVANMSGWDEVLKATKIYNEKPERKDDVEAVQIEDDSLQAFLYKRADVAVRDFTDRLQDIECSIDSLSGNIRDLLREAERQRKSEEGG